MRPKRHKLQRARQSIGKTQSAIADYLDMTSNGYQAIELGRRGTTSKNWLKLFKALIVF
jgi:transcriptional regulator with XRE-family HTH domain